MAPDEARRGRVPSHTARRTLTLDALAQQTSRCVSEQRSGSCDALILRRKRPALIPILAGGLDGQQQTQTFITALVTGLIVLGAEVRSGNRSSRMRQSRRADLSTLSPPYPLCDRRDVRHCLRPPSRSPPSSSSRTASARSTAPALTAFLPSSSRLSTSPAAGFTRQDSLSRLC